MLLIFLCFTFTFISRFFSGLTPSSNNIVQNRSPSAIWQEDIIPKWDEVKSAPWVRDMWRRGLPDDVRGAVWKLAIGNQMGITYALYPF